MKISDILKEKFTFSMEVFPPKKTGDTQKLLETIKNLKNLKPDFISVTYGAGGSTRTLTKEIAGEINNNIKINAMAHLTCIGNSKSEIKNILRDLETLNIENILALRGDLPQDAKKEDVLKDFQYASDLVKLIKKEKPGLSIGVAGYVEKHPEAVNLEKDIDYLKMKVDEGAEFIMTQLFFDNEKLYRFIDLCRKKGIKVPILPGIFLIFNFKQLTKMHELSGGLTIPEKLFKQLEKYQDSPEDVKKIGMDFAIEQSREIIKNKIVQGIHFYIMNRDDLIQKVYQSVI